MGDRASVWRISGDRDQYQAREDMDAYSVSENERFEINIAAYATRCTNDLAQARAERDAAQAQAAGYREALSILAKWARGIVPADDLPRGWHKVDAALSQPEPPVLARLRAAERVVESAKSLLVILDMAISERGAHPEQIEGVRQAAMSAMLAWVEAGGDDALAERDGGV